MKHFFFYVVWSIGAVSFVADGRAAEVEVDADSVVRYVESCRKANGAFGPYDQEYTDAAWNYPAVRTLQLLDREITKPEAILEHGLGSPAGHTGMGHYHFYHRHAIRAALASTSPGDLRTNALRPVAIRHEGFKLPYYVSPYGTDNELLYAAPSGGCDPRQDADGTMFYYSNLSSLHYLLAGLKASGREPAEPRPLIEYVRRRFAGGGFTDVRQGDTMPSALDVHLGVTWHAVAALQLLGSPVPESEKIAAFVHACRTKDGGYKYAVRAGGENVPDVYYVWAALHTLRSLGVEPDKADDTRAWLNSLQNADGGFGDRPGRRSRLYSTFYAVEALSLLGGDARSKITTKRIPQPQGATIDGEGLHIFQAQFKMPIVAIEDLDGLHRRGFNLLAIKSYDWDAAERLVAAIRERKLPMDVVLCPEAYPHRLVHTGNTTLNHVGNFTLDPRWTAAEREAWTTADAAGREYLPWLGYRDRVVRPMAALGAVAYPEQDYDLEYAYADYGDDRSGERGYNAVLVGFNWQPRDFVRVFPWRERYVDLLTPIADVDAHGDLKKWTSHLDTTRTLFIARGPTYADFREAAAAGRVVTVIAEPEGVPSGATYYGPPAAVEYVRERAQAWRWW